MADVSAEPTALCDGVDGNANEGMTDAHCSVSKSKQDVIEKLAHKNSSLPNGCAKHVLEENGILKLMEKAEGACEKTSDMTGGGDMDREECACQQRVLAHARVKDGVTDKSDSTIGNVKNVSELAPGQHVDLDGCIDSIAKVNIVESEITPSENVPASVCSELDVQGDLDYVVYESEIQMPDIMKLITKDLSEPYSIYTYRYFIHNWPKLCFLAMDRARCVGAIVCKLDMHKKMVRRGYIAMLAVDQNYRRRGIGSHLVMKAIRAMVADECDEVVLETEITNEAALRLYENLGFVRDKRLFRYYLNGVDALRLKLWLR